MLRFSRSNPTEMLPKYFVKLTHAMINLRSVVPAIIANSSKFFQASKQMKHQRIPEKELLKAFELFGNRLPEKSRSRYYKL